MPDLPHPCLAFGQSEPQGSLALHLPLLFRPQGDASGLLHPQPLDIVQHTPSSVDRGPGARQEVTRRSLAAFSQDAPNDDLLVLRAPSRQRDSPSFVVGSAPCPQSSIQPNLNGSITPWVP